MPALSVTLYTAVSLAVAAHTVLIRWAGFTPSAKAHISTLAASRLFGLQQPGAPFRDAPTALSRCSRPAHTHTSHCLRRAVRPRRVSRATALTPPAARPARPALPRTPRSARRDPSVSDRADTRRDFRRPQGDGAARVCVCRVTCTSSRPCWT